MRTVAAVVLVTLAFLPYVIGMPSVISYTFTTIDDPAANILDGEQTEAAAINAEGDIVGNFGPRQGKHGFLYHQGTFTNFDVPGALYTFPTGINSAGQIVGTFIDGIGQHGFLYSGGVFTQIDVPGATNPNLLPGATSANGINAAGQIVGNFDVVTTDHRASTHAFIYDNGVFTIFDFPGAYSTQAFAINSAGDIVGGMALPGVGGASGFIYSRGTFTPISNPNATAPNGNLLTVANGINERGDIAGFFTDVGAYRGFVYDHGTFTTLDFPPGGDIPMIPLGINNSGSIVGYFNSVNGHHGFLATPVH
jgi:probable HAF family extracellular repeat protein